MHTAPCCCAEPSGAGQRRAGCAHCVLRWLLSTAPLAPPHSATPPRQVLIAFKKAYELNGKPEVYGPLASCADALQRWMRVR